MSSQYRPHFGPDPVTGVRALAVPSGEKIIWADGNTKPADAVAGYEHGCLFQDKNGTTGADALQINIGSKTSANFDNVLTTTDSVALTATAAEINRAADVSTRMVNLGASQSIDEATHEGKVLAMNLAGGARTYTLPAATGGGGRYDFFVQAVNTSNYIIAAFAGDTFYGNIYTNSTGDSPDLGQPWVANGSTAITLNGTTTGGVLIGDTIQLTDIAPNVWRLIGFTTSSGMEATPLS